MVKNQLSPRVHVLRLRESNACHLTHIFGVRAGHSHPCDSIHSKAKIEHGRKNSQHEYLLGEYHEHGLHSPDAHPPSFVYQRNLLPRYSTRSQRHSFRGSTLRFVYEPAAIKKECEGTAADSLLRADKPGRYRFV